MFLLKSLIGLLTLPLAWLPAATASAFGAWGGARVFRLWASRRKFAVDNVRRAIESGALTPGASPEEIARESFRNMGRSIVELVRLVHGRGRELLENTRVVGLENYQRARAKGKGIMMFTGHCGNWELMAITMAHFYRENLFVLARAQNNHYLDRLVENMRSITGNRVLYKQGAVKNILKILKNKDVVGILIDQAVLVKEGCLVSFLNRPAVTTKLPALIARKTGVPLMPIFMHRLPDGSSQITIHPEVALSDPDREADPVVADMQAMTGWVEDFIRNHPDQWLWGHRRWKRAPEKLPE